MGSWRQKLLTKEKGVITKAAVQCYMHEYYTEQHYNSRQVCTA